VVYPTESDLRKTNSGIIHRVTLSHQKIGAKAADDFGYSRLEGAPQLGGAVFGEAGLEADAEKAAGLGGGEGGCMVRWFLSPGKCGCYDGQIRSALILQCWPGAVLAV
jgi:hypothetical protein